MDNQHREISGYRELEQEDIDLINEVKALSTECGKLIGKLEKVKDNWQNTYSGESEQANTAVEIVESPIRRSSLSYTNATANPVVNMMKMVEYSLEDIDSVEEEYHGLNQILSTQPRQEESKSIKSNSDGRPAFALKKQTSIRIDNIVNNMIGEDNLPTPVMDRKTKMQVDFDSRLSQSNYAHIRENVNKKWKNKFREALKDL